MSQTRQQRRAQQRKAAQKPPRKPRRPVAWRWVVGGGIVIVLVAVAVTIMRTEGATDERVGEPEPSASGLPKAADYHSLIVAPDDPNRVFLGTHDGLFESADAGKTWRQTGAIEGDAMNLARDAKDAETLYAAGHQLFQKSSDGGSTWTDIPLDDAISRELGQGGRGVDIHGFASDPANAGTVYAAVAGTGLFRSTDAAEHFTKLSDTGAAGFGIAIASTRPPRIYLADAQQGLLLSENDGKTWEALQSQITGVAVSPRDPKRVLAAGDALYLAIDGRKFRSVLKSDGDGFGALAIAPSDPAIAYAIGLPGTLYVSKDGGANWTTV